MKIKSRLLLLTAGPFTMLAVAALVGLFSFRNLAHAYQLNFTAQTIQARAFGLNLLINEYLDYRSERARQQWRQQYDALSRALAEAAKLEYREGLIEPILVRHREIGRSFEVLVDYVSLNDVRTASVREAWLKRLGSQLQIETYGIFSDATRLSELAARNIQQEQTYLLASSLVALVFVGILVGVISLWTSRSITLSLLRLRHAAERIAAGNLDVRADTGTRDEHQELADVLNEMASRLKSTQQQLVQSEKMSALGTLAAGIAHELNNPMMGVLTYVDYVRQHREGKDVDQVLGNAKRELERMRDLLRNMLAFARPVEEKVTEIDVSTVVQRALTLVQAELKARSITLSTDFQPALPKVKVKENHLQQVFLNLLLNARDAVAEAPERRIGVSVVQRESKVSVEISDSGPGVPTEIQSRIFDPFFTTKSPGKGTGLGLSIARNIMDDLGGSLSFRSYPGEGATFVVDIPAHES